MSIRLIMGVLSMLCLAVSAQAETQEFLVRMNSADPAAQRAFIERNGGKLEVVSLEGQLFKWTSSQRIDLTWDANIDYVQPNHQISIFQSPSLVEHRAQFLAAVKKDEATGGKRFGNARARATDNPEIPSISAESAGSDPLLKDAWGIFNAGADLSWKKTPQGKDIIVAVTDTGVDYTHQDLINSMWRNPGEIAGNGIDDDKNGFIDDVVGWDFSSNDNKPYDLAGSLFEILLKGANPGHGTHVSGVIGARLNNGLGTAGVAPQVKIMALRFINESGKGDDANAIKAIDYAVNNGANIINASWGGEAGGSDDKALKDAIARAEKKGVIFVAAAGNGRADSKTGTSAGFDNDNDPKPMVPASYTNKNIVTVAAIDSSENLAKFSNWGNKTVKLGAPGVKILSTVPGNKYQDTVIDIGPIKATWDGTSMAAPFVSGALAVVWSTSKAKTAEEVIDRLMKETTAITSLKGKVVTEGRLELKNLR